MFIDRHMQLAGKIAEATPKVSDAKIAAVIAIRNNIISVGVNQHKTHPMQAKYAKREDAIYLHAEINAIRNAIKNVDPHDLEKSSMHIVRMMRNQQTLKYQWGLSKPCIGCQRAIVAFGIKHTHYSIFCKNKIQFLSM